MLVTRVIGDCPSCKGRSCYGNVDIYRDHVLRGCKQCKYSDRIYLPPVRKAILYLDQFFFSGAFRGSDTRFTHAAERVRRVSDLQLLVAPYSSVHEDETHQWARRDELFEFIKATSHGHEFEPAYDVEKTQLLKGFAAWLARRGPDYDLERSDAFAGDLEEWDGYFRIDVGRYMGDIELIRNLKRQAIEGLVDLFPEWRKSTQTFDEDVAGELRAAAKGYMEAYLDFMLRVGGGDYNALFDAPIISMVVQQMLYVLPQEMAPDEKLRQCLSFFASTHFSILPYHDIEAKAFAALKAMVKAGAYTNRDNALARLKGFSYDVKHVATYAPYCHAFVMDQPMAELMSHPRIALEQRYGTRVFSLNNWGDFVTWLDGLEINMTEDHRSGLATAYP